MRSNRFVAAAAALLVSVALPSAEAAEDAQPVSQRHWQPVKSDDIGASGSPATSATPTRAEQRAYVDPVTRELVAAPVVPPEPELGADARAPQPLMLPQRTPEGFIYLDTSGYQMEMKATLDADGNVHVGCTDAAHRHAPSPAREPRP
jgi:hypothetical protein